MGARSDGVRRAKRAGRSIWVIDFRYLDKERREQRFRRDARVQTAEGARTEARQRRQRALDTGSPEPRAAAPTFAEFVSASFRPLHLKVKCRPATIERYEYLLRQGILDAFGALTLDGSFLAPTRAYVAQLVARGVQPRPHVSFIRCVLRSAFDLGVLERLPDLPPLPKGGRKLPDAPNKEHVTKLLAHAPGWALVGLWWALEQGSGHDGVSPRYGFGCLDQRRTQRPRHVRRESYPSSASSRTFSRVVSPRTAQPPHRGGGAEGP